MIEYPYWAAYSGTFGAHRFDRLRMLRETNAWPPAMADSTADGTMFHEGEWYYDTDAHEYNKYMIQPELARPPMADVSALMWQVGNHMHFEISVTNRSGVTLSPSNSAYVTAVVYEDVVHLAPPNNTSDTSRVARAAPQVAITTPLADGATATYSIDTPDLSGVNWSKLHGVAFADYIPGDKPVAYWDMLQAAVATYHAQAPALAVSPDGVSSWFPYTNRGSETKSIAMNGYPANMTWTATKTQPWLSLSATGGTLPASINLTVNSAGMGLGSYSDTLHITAAGPAGPLTKDIPVTLVVYETRTFLYLSTIWR